MAELEEGILRKAEFKPYLWWRYVDHTFFLWEHGEEKLKSFIDNINKMYPTRKFTADWSKTSIKFLDVTVSITEGIVETDLYVKPTQKSSISFAVFLSSLLLQKGYTIQLSTKASSLIKGAMA